MAVYKLHQDVKNCIGCHSCTIACKSLKNLPYGPLPNQVMTVGPEFHDGRPRAAHIFMACFHCEDPVCVDVCPTGAMHLAEHGIVTVDHQLCQGCKVCIQACPWGAVQWHPAIGRVVKCDFCLDRLRQGMQPMCVTVCTTHCLHFEAAPESSS